MRSTRKSWNVERGPTAPGSISTPRLSARVSAQTATVCLAAIPILALAGMAWRNRWIFDDAFIDFRVVANLHHGLGPVWNSGERVEVYTSPLWVAALGLTSSALSFVPVEWIAVVLGGLGTIAGCLAAARGSWLLWRDTGRTGVGLPLGLLVIVALPPMWKWATSGLETGATFLWLGGCFWALARLAPDRSKPPRRAGWGRLPRLTPTWVAVAIGIGPLVRPDLGIFSIGFMIALLVAAPRRRRSTRLQLIGWALLLPVAYEVFRMGYFAAVEPNTALAKEAALADWSRGWTYLKNFVDPYLLFIPLGLLFAYVILELRGAARPARAAVATAVAAVTCGLLHALYLVRVGGDFAGARMLLPSLFGVLLPVAVVIPRQRAWHVALGLAVIPWALVCAGTLRSIGDPIGVDRGLITLHDSRNAIRARAGWALRRLSTHGRALVLRVPVTASPLSVSGVPRASSPTPVVAGVLTVGMIGYAAGPRVHIVDELGIADPLGARTRLGPLLIPRAEWALRVPGRSRYYHAPARGLAGHEKYLPTEWVVARFAPAGLNRVTHVALLSPAGVAAARRALRCPPLHRLLTAVTAPLSLGRFMSNIGESFSLSSLRFDADPVHAEHELCTDNQPA